MVKGSSWTLYILANRPGSPPASRAGEGLENGAVENGAIKEFGVPIKVRTRYGVIVSVLAFGLVCGFHETAHAEPGAYWGFEEAYIDYGSEMKNTFTHLQSWFEYFNIGYSFEFPVFLEAEFNLDLITNGNQPFYGAAVGYTFRADQALRPILKVGWERDGLKVNLPSDKVTFWGGGYSIGIGVDYAIAPVATVGLAVTKRFITYDYLQSNVYKLSGNINGDQITYGIRMQVNF